MTPKATTRERGQVLAIFALALVAIIAMTGLVLDGGSTFVQRRDMQNIADSAAMAAAYDFLNTGSESSAVAAAQANALANGYPNGTAGIVVNASVGNGTMGSKTVTVSVTKPHQNHFAGIVGMPSWNVSTTATSIAGPPNAAIGAMPIIFNEKAFPKSINPNVPISFDLPGTGTQDVPQGEQQFNWTVYCTANGADTDGDPSTPNNCNANSKTVANLINNLGTSTTILLTDDIGPMNAGDHATLFSGLAAHVGETFPVCIVDNAGEMLGWAMFHLTGSVGGSTKQISGYFLSEYNSSSIYIAQGGGPGNSAFGGHDVRLIN